MRIVFTFAVASEFAPWRRMRRFHRVSGEPALYRARIGSADVYAVVTGIGMRSVNGQFGRLLSENADVCVAAGLAGGLKAEYTAGTILVARTIQTDESNESTESDPRLVDIGVRCGATAVNVFQSNNAVVASSVEKQQLAASADAVDIESFAVVDQAHRCGIRAVAIRAVSDPVERNMPLDFNRAVNENGTLDWSALFLQLAKAPFRIPELIRFGRDSVRAAQNLARFLDRYVVEIG